MHDLTTEEAIRNARIRVGHAYSPASVRLGLQVLQELLGQHFEQVENCRASVLNWETPRRNITEALEWLDSPGPHRKGEFASALSERVALMLRKGNNLHDPRYIGHQVPAPIPVAALFDLVGSVTNQVMAIYEMGPWATAVEAAVVEKLGQLIGWNAGDFSGFATHGGSLANLTALLTARNVRFPDAWTSGWQRDRRVVMVVHSDVHYSITRSAGVLGMGTDQIVRAPLDHLRRIDVQALEEQLSELHQGGNIVLAVVACACATPIGAFDRLTEIAEVCRRARVWLHVDAAHGGATLFSNRHNHLVDGLDRADSIVWDAHKMMFVPALCAFVFYKHRDHRYATFQQEAPYLFDPESPDLAEFDSGKWTIECTKRAATYGIWGIWSLYGTQLFADLVDVTFATAKRLHELLAAADDFQVLHEPQANIVAFRHVPAELQGAATKRIGEFQLRLRRDLIRSGEYYIVQSMFEGVGALRVTVCNPLTQSSHLEGLMETLRKRGKAILKAHT